MVFLPLLARYFGFTSNCGHILHRHIHMPKRTPFHGWNLLFASIANTYDTFNQNLVWLSIADEFAKSFCSTLVGQFAHNQAYDFLCVVTITTDKWLIFFAVFLHYVQSISRGFSVVNHHTRKNISILVLFIAGHLEIEERF